MNLTNKEALDIVLQLAEEQIKHKSNIKDLIELDSTEEIKKGIEAIKICRSLDEQRLLRISPPDWAV